MMNIKSSFFKVKSPKKFGYTPRYYDERKERREKLLAKHSGNEKEADRVERELRLRSAFSEKRKFSGPDLRAEMRSRTIRLLIILVGVIGLIFYILHKYGLTEHVF